MSATSLFILYTSINLTLPISSISARSSDKCRSRLSHFRPNPFWPSLRFLCWSRSYLPGLASSFSTPLSIRLPLYALAPWVRRVIALQVCHIRPDPFRAVPAILARLCSFNCAEMTHALNMSTAQDRSSTQCRLDLRFEHFDPVVYF